MRFRAKMQGSEPIVSFCKMIHSVGKVANMAAMVIQPEKIELRVTETIVNRFSVQIDIPKQHFFSSYDFEGVNPDSGDNQIMIGIDPKRVYKFIKTNVGKAKYMRLKLSVKELDNNRAPIPILHFTIGVPFTGSMGRHRVIIHEIPIDIIPRPDWSLYAAPSLSSVTFDMEMDIEERWEALCNILQRVKVLAASIRVHGTFTEDKGYYLFLETFKGTSVTSWTEFCAFPVDKDNSQEADEGDRTRSESNPEQAKERTAVSIDVRRLGAFVSNWPLEECHAEVKFAKNKQLTLIVYEDVLGVKTVITLPHVENV